MLPTLRLIALLLPLTLVAGGGGTGDPLASRGWIWPVDAVRVLRPFVAPVQAYGPGHRGVDLGDARILRAPAAGTIAFAGDVAGRPVVTIEHEEGLVTTFDPAIAARPVGSTVGRGEVVAMVAPPGHTGAETVHFGVRDHGEYVNPLRLLGGIPRAVLLPCC